ncbi:hypothetical protein G6L28_18240 [Agrobacterium larrymoorei]|uniref:hypothetical protein n=1 Tax=Agrobacterium larrymoorei TaxID=160699 RepID=UPI001573AD34|nr:hypothetical protein [Agrobacterium larrymoorei]NTJ44541.1 hypothetical protein [Agrobacterium larrymoorei]
MPIGFNLFSFDIFHALRRPNKVAERSTASERDKISTEDDGSDERQREREADMALWGFAYYPVM